MPQNANDIRVAVTGNIFSGPVGTAMPTDISAAPVAAFMDHGFTTPDGIGLVPTIDSVDIDAWQSSSPVRTVVRRRIYEAKFKLIQTSRDNTVLVHGGGAWTGAAGKFVFTPPPGTNTDQRAWIFQYADGTIHKRYCIPRGQVTSIAEIKWVNNAATEFELTVKWIGNDWFMQSDDPADDPAGLAVGGGGGEDTQVAPDAPTQSSEPVNETPPLQVQDTPAPEPTSGRRRAA